MNNKNTQRAQTSFAKSAHYPHTAQIRDLESKHGDPDRPINLIKCFLCHCRAVLLVSSKSNHNLLSKGQTADWTVNMVIWITKKIESIYLPKPLQKISMQSGQVFIVR